MSIIWRPAAFHGHHQAPFFEGWFFKLVDRERQNVIAVIPGIYLARDPSESHAFIQVLTGDQHRSVYQRFPVEQFKASRRELAVEIAGNYFRADGMRWVITDTDLTVRGHVAFSALTPWPVSLLSPGVMGWYTFVPFMQCYHGVLSFDHALDGSLVLNHRNIDLTGGRGYIEKDWGRSFPDAYLWLQCNHFTDSGVSLMASVAQIPWLTSAFRGFLVGLRIDGTLYRFTTYNGARLERSRVSDSQVEMIMTTKSHRIELCAFRGNGGLLCAPSEKSMKNHVSESLTSTVHVEISHHRRGVIYSGTGYPAGLDVNGRLELIATLA